MAEHGAEKKGWFSKVTALLGHHGAEAAAGNFKRYGVEPFVPIFLIILTLSILMLVFDREALLGMLAALTVLSPFWLPVLLAKFFWITWIEYLRYQFWFSHDMILLEIQLPPEVEKSPLSMELFLTTLWQTGGETSVLNRIWKGRTRAVWSLEIASNEGRIGFYIHLRSSFKDVVEARLYGQFPEAKITQVEDYARKIPFNTDDYKLWGCEFRKTGPGALPIKTYVDYELNKDTDKPETKVDPMTNMLELFSTAKKDEWFWMQIIVRAHKPNEWFGLFKKADNYKDGAAKEIKDMMTKAGERAKSLVGGTDEALKAQAAARGLTLLSGGEKLRVEAIEHSLSKLTFDCGVVVMYISKPNNFNFINIMNTVRLFDPYKGSDGVSQYNAINPTRGMAGYDYPWQDYKGILQRRDQRKMFFRYVNRAYFFVPYDQEPIYFSSEELATIWHFPTSTVQTPGLSRVTSSLSEAPRNLPTLPS